MLFHEQNQVPIRVPIPSTFTPSSISEKSNCPKRRGDPPTIYFSTQATKRHRTEVVQQNELPDNTKDNDVDSKRPRSVDMCGQFEEVVSTLPPPSRRSSQPLAHIFLAPQPTTGRNSIFFDFNEQAGSVQPQPQHQMQTHMQTHTQTHNNHIFTTNQPPVTTQVQGTNQIATHAESEAGTGDEQDATETYFPFMDMGMNSSDFQLLKQYASMNNDCNLIQRQQQQQHRQHQQHWQSHQQQGHQHQQDRNQHQQDPSSPFPRWPDQFKYSYEIWPYPGVVWKDYQFAPKYMATPSPPPPPPPRYSTEQRYL